MTKYHSIKNEVLEKLERSLPTLQEKFGVATIGIFGSVSRGEDTVESDVDVCYSFLSSNDTYENLLNLGDFLEDLFGRKVDLVSLEWMNKRFYASVMKDAEVFTPQKGAV